MLEILQWFKPQKANMRSLVLSLLLLISFIRCSSNKNSEVFDSDELKGKYKVDLTPILSKAKADSEVKNEWEQLGQNIAMMAFSSIDIEMNFYDNNKGVFHIDGGLVNFVSAFSDDPMQKTHQFDYKVENDSILYMKNSDGQDFNKWAIIRKFSSNYDYIQLLILEENKGKVLFNLNKLK